MYWNLTINSTEPIFYYCSAPGSCIDHQMVGVINPNDTQTLEAQIDYAKNADFAVAPGEDIPSEGRSTLSNPSPTSTPTSSPSSTPAHPDSHKLSAGAIAGIVVGAVVFLAICAALFFYVGRTKSLKDVLKQKDTTTKAAPSTPGNEYPSSPGFPGSPFSPHQSMAHQSMSEYGGYHPNARESHLSGWTSPHQGHLSMQSMAP
jgi:hypothetical protein